MNVAKKAWISKAFERKINIPEPSSTFTLADDYSGKFTLRVPKSIHKKLVEQSIKEEVSLNQFVNTLISYQLGKKSINDEVKNQLLKTRPVKIVLHNEQKDKEIDVSSFIPKAKWPSNPGSLNGREDFERILGGL